MNTYEVGEIFYFLPYHLNWKIPRFSDLPQQSNSRIWSPKFGYVKESEEYEIAPPGWSEYEDTYYINLSLTSAAYDTVKCVPYNCIRVGVTNQSGKEINVRDCIWNSSYGGFDGLNLLLKDEISLRREGEIPGYLRFFCEIPSKACRESLDAATQTESENGLDTLSQNFKEMLIQEKDTDLTIKVQEREFSAHRPILRARSPVFDAMLSHNLKENNENVIEIEDCEPEVFQEFLLFIYSGKTENIAIDNVFGLYYAADKYNLPDLKSVCINFLKTNLSVVTILEVICLSTKHKETELLNLAINYFANNLDEILTTCKWLMFMKDNPVEANDLYITALKLGFTKKCDHTKN